ncbi:FKBP-type peptidyl-prolyl cis-trans isomerase [Nocardioides sp. SLBN-35]|uniref:FKBP-type peptidyl-prolyl cis-trans isomerase n=1 Tax=Nocardioides sp. SLBN-35 TaxID=2768445 RepID=UPI00116D319B|nr:FKBP-type peptidyl-prolyl cis-trans isomerase [Nocardioides sp. SLBN-35]TQK71114.1 peptidylprolyl isomerase [Nocardioides sp. SLBN-35]
MRLRRPSMLLLSTLLPASLVLAACGGSDSDEAKGLDAVTISGPVGEAPKLDWKSVMTAKKPVAKVLTEGDGAALKKGDVVRVEFTLADGWTHKVPFDSYAATSLSTLVTVGTEKEPQTLTDLLSLGFADQIKAGQKVGSRIAVTVGSDVAFGGYLGSQAAGLLAGLDIGNEDGLLFVADIAGIAGPEGSEEPAPGWAPKVVETDGVPTSLDFKGAPKPSGDLEVATLVKGTGPVVAKGQTILASYLGQIPGADKPFDESYSKHTGLEAVVGGKDASVVKGWSQALVGLPVGSRVLIQIPPKLGYGDKAQGEDIPANSTLYFVVDILDAADTPPKPEPAPEATPTDGAAPTDGATDPSAEPSTDASTEE